MRSALLSQYQSLSLNVIFPTKCWCKSELESDELFIGKRINWNSIKKRSCIPVGKFDFPLCFWSLESDALILLGMKIIFLSCVESV